ncbi:MAG: hypothetical protein VXY53_06330, partial [Candidatus Thermoplasmatota archaeon]|nr:hypothetical protein [Candidatus Thermoplasmatota archaeon]
MENDDLEPNITLEETFDADGNLEGYEATYQDAGREYVIEYDENFNYESETVTKLYDDLFTLEESEESFQTAWGLISSDLAGITDGHTLTFASAGDNQIVVLGNSNAVLLRVNSWSGEHDWTGWDGTAYNNQDSHYNFHDADWNHLGNAGSYERYITADSEGNVLDTPVLDETGTHLGFSSEDADVISENLADYAESISEHLEVEVADITEVHLSSSAWQGLDHELRDEYFEEWSDSNERIELRGENHEFLGSLELRDGFIEIRDDNWQTLARILDGDGLSVEDIEAEYAGFQEAWNAVKEYLPSEFEPEVDESNLKFSIDDWGNIIVFDGAGAMIGRVHSWDYENSWSRYEDGEEYTITNTSTGFNFNDADWNDIGRYETSDRDYTHLDDVALAESFDDETTVFTSYSVTSDDASNAAWAALGDSYYLPNLSDDTKETVETALGMTWDSVDKVSIGENQITRQANQFREVEEVGEDTRIEYFEAVTEGEGDNTWTYYNFLGTVEMRDGFIEVRDSSWNEVFRAIDVSAAKTLEEIAATNAGFQDAWDAVGEFLPASLRDEGVRFTSDDWHIYAFSAAGELVSNINFWNGEHTWTGWDGT